MLNNNMTLKQMLDYSPSDEEMLSLDHDVILYIKVSFMSMSYETNREIIKHILLDSEAKDYFKNYDATLFYDFKSKDNKCLTITELFAKAICQETLLYLHELLKKYHGEGIYLLNIYTHDNHQYNISNIDGEINIEQIR